jgi:hypothetical protein
MVDMNQEAYQSLRYWMKERHKIYERRFVEKRDPPWTDDPILREFKFTNVYRELDRVTHWMRRYWTSPNDDPTRPDLMLFNCALFRVFGTIEAAQVIGWQRGRFDWRTTAAKAEKYRQTEGKLFTSAYIITNAVRGTNPTHAKTRVVSEGILKPLWEQKRELAARMVESQSLEKSWELLGELSGFGGQGFIAYEVITDLRHTSVLRGASDIYTWANAGPGARRMLNVLFGRELRFRPPKSQTLSEMQVLQERLKEELVPGDLPTLEIRDVEHSLCETFKYWRTLKQFGRPKSLFVPSEGTYAPARVRM